MSRIVIHRVSDAVLDRRIRRAMPPAKRVHRSAVADRRRRDPHDRAAKHRRGPDGGI